MGGDIQNMSFSPNYQGLYVQINMAFSSFGYNTWNGAFLQTATFLQNGGYATLDKSGLSNGVQVGFTATGYKFPIFTPRVSRLFSLEQTVNTWQAQPVS